MLESFVQLKSEMTHDVAAIYDEIGNELSQGNSSNLVASLIRLETEKINIYISELVGKTRETAIAALKAQGYPEYMTAGAWTKILRKAGMPEIQLCSVQQLNGVLGTPKAEPSRPKEKNARYAEQINALEFNRNVSIGAAAVGGTAVVAALIIPGWEALPVAMLCAGGVVLVGGSVSAIMAQSQIETVKTRLEKEQARTQSAGNRGADTSFAKKMAALQAQRNTEAIGQWIDMVEQAVIQTAATV